MANRQSDHGSRFLVVPALGSDLSQGDATHIEGSAVVESGMSDYAQLRSGAISLDDYLSLSVDRAVAHLHGQLDDEQIEAMRAVLRSSLTDDPHLIALAARASGH